MMKKKIVCYFSQPLSDQPIIYRLVKDFDLIINIIKADINPEREGYLVLELDGPKAMFDKGVDYLKEISVEVEPLSENISWHEDLCIQCGACASFCPSTALAMDRESMLVSFDDEKCVICGMCLECCPTNAIKIEFDLSETV
jgi:ferredoxin